MQQLMQQENENFGLEVIEPTHESIDLPIRTSETIGEGLKKSR